MRACCKSAVFRFEIQMQICGPCWGTPGTVIQIDKEFLTPRKILLRRNAAGEITQLTVPKSTVPLLLTDTVQVVLSTLALKSTLTSANVLALNSVALMIRVVDKPCFFITSLLHRLRCKSLIGNIKYCLAGKLTGSDVRVSLTAIAD